MKKLLILLSIPLVLLVLVVLYAMFIRTDLTITKAQGKELYSTPNSHFLQWRNAEIHYTDAGQGTPMLMIHGFGGNFTNFDSLSDILDDQYRVVRVDLPGFGLSDLPEKRDSVAELYRDFLGFMLDTLHMDSLYVVGNSLGGWMSWDLAATHPQRVKGLVLLGSAGYEIEKVKSNIGRLDLLDNAIVHKIVDRGIPRFVSLRSARRMLSEWEEPDLNALAKNNGIMNIEGNIHNLLSLGNSGVVPDTTKIAQIQCPTLVIWGKQDIIVPYEHTEKFKRDIATCKVIVYDTCGHIPQMEYPHRVANDIEQYFSMQ